MGSISAKHASGNKSARNRMDTAAAVIRLIRPQQYAKNAFIILPLFFSGKLFGGADVVPTLLAFFAFCLAASAVYIFNDIFDIEDDRKHPTKCNRPIARGEVSLLKAIVLIIALTCGGLLIARCLPGWMPFGILVLYFLLNTAYTLKLKRIELIDITCVAFGFVLRVYMGAVVGGVAISHWLLMMTFLLAMFLALGKRWDDLCIEANGGEKVRKSLNSYNKQFVSHAMQLMAGVNIVSYIMYTTSQDVMDYYGSRYLFLTAFWVLLGMLRYFQIAFVYQSSGSPTAVLYKDTFIQIVLACWMLHFFILLHC